VPGIMATTEAPAADWIDARTAQQRFGLSKTKLYHLRRAGAVVSSSVATPGKSRGKRLYAVGSLKSVILRGVGQ